MAALISASGCGPFARRVAAKSCLEEVGARDDANDIFAPQHRQPFDATANHLIHRLAELGALLNRLDIAGHHFPDLSPVLMHIGLGEIARRRAGNSSQPGRLRSLPSSSRRRRSPWLKIPLSSCLASKTNSALTRERNIVSIASPMPVSSATPMTPMGSLRPEPAFLFFLAWGCSIRRGRMGAGGKALGNRQIAKD